MLLPPTAAAPPRWQDPALLDFLARVREPWAAAARRVVRAVLRKYLPHPGGPAAEVGAGGGQLRDWLPPGAAADTTHTEPSEPFLDVLRRRFPGANVARAGAEKLPFADGSLAGVFALCVLDTVPDLAAVRDEARRVLRPGGVVVHFLDLGTSPYAAFAELVAGGEVPLTNFTADLGLTADLPAAKRALLPPADEFDEVLAVRWEAFRGFAGMLEASGHPVAADLGPYTRLAYPGRLDPDRLGREFMAYRAEPPKLRALNRALTELTLLARHFGREWPVRAVSLRAHLRARLRAAFAAEHGFAVEFAGPVAVREQTRGPSVLRHAGRTVTRTEPGVIPGTPVELLEGTAPPRPDDRPVRATTIEVFVARKLGPLPGPWFGPLSPVLGGEGRGEGAARPESGGFLPPTQPSPREAGGRGPTLESHREFGLALVARTTGGPA